MITHFLMKSSSQSQIMKAPATSRRKSKQDMATGPSGIGDHVYDELMKLLEDILGESVGPLLVGSGATSYFLGAALPLCVSDAGVEPGVLLWELLTHIDLSDMELFIWNDSWTERRSVRLCSGDVEVCRRIRWHAQRGMRQPALWGNLGPERSGFRSVVVQGWFRSGSGLVQVWFRSGSGLVQGWFRSGSGLVQGWFRSGSGLDQVWFRAGSGLVQGWFMMARGRGCSAPWFMSTCPRLTRPGSSHCPNWCFSVWFRQNWLFLH